MAAMSSLKIYGVPLSRAYRALWMANELGLDYENVPINFADGSAKTPEYLAVNPNGRIPAIDDNGFKLWESMAINLDLAKKHGSVSLPKTMDREPRELEDRVVQPLRLISVTCSGTNQLCVTVEDHPKRTNGSPPTIRRSETAGCRFGSRPVQRGFDRPPWR